MAEGQKEPRHSMLMGSEDGDHRRSLLMGCQECYDYYCQPCDFDHCQVEAMYYCSNCEEYLCKKCSTFHKKFKQSMDHVILDIQLFTHKPPLSNERSTNSVSAKPTPASTRVVTMATHVKDIKIQGYIISSALMSTNQLLVVGCRHRKVRLVDSDTKSGILVSEVELSGRPWQVTRISDTEAAVTIPGQQKIVLLRTQPQLSVVRQICVQEKCYGIAYMDNRIVVTSKGHVDILDMSGKVLLPISADQTGKESFNWPHYVTMDTATGMIMYVSEWMETVISGKVVKPGMRGSVGETYTRSSESGGYPSQVALDSQGMVYVAWCGRSGRSGCIYQLSANSLDRMVKQLFRR